MKKEVLCNCCKVPVHKTTSEINRNKSGLFYCSKSCAAQVNNKTSQKRIRTITCKTCECPILSGWTYCDKCYVKKHFLI